MKCFGSTKDVVNIKGMKHMKKLFLILLCVMCVLAVGCQKKELPADLENVSGELEQNVSGESELTDKTDILSGEMANDSKHCI